MDYSNPRPVFGPQGYDVKGGIANISKNRGVNFSD
jgi:hypothetical protein